MAKSDELSREQKQVWWKRHCEYLFKEIAEESKKWDRLSEKQQERFCEIPAEHRQRGTRFHCPICQERFHLDNLYICTQCGTDYCFRCVWQLENFGDQSNPRWRCPCGSEAMQQPDPGVGGYVARPVSVCVVWTRVVAVLSSVDEPMPT